MPRFDGTGPRGMGPGTGGGRGLCNNPSGERRPPAPGLPSSQPDHPGIPSGIGSTLLNLVIAGIGYFCSRPTGPGGGTGRRGRLERR